MSLWVDKYRPNCFNKLDYHKEQAEKIKQLICKGDFPHLLVYGPPGSGKKTRIMCILRSLYGNGVEKLRIEHQSFTTPSKKRLDISTIASNYHIEVNPSDVGIYDRIVVQELLKSVAQTHQLDSVSQKDFKVILINDTDKLTRDAQHALRRTMEKYMATCRLVLCCNSSSRVISAIRSRCLTIRVPAPTTQQIGQILLNTCKKESFNISIDLVNKIAEKSNRNLRRALLMCEVCKVQQYSSGEQQVLEPDWEKFLKETADLIIQQQSPKRLLEVRGRIYELMAHCIPSDVIIKGLLNELLKNCDGQLKSQIIQMAAFYEHRMQLGQKHIYHIEAFIAKFMCLFKRFLEDGVLQDFNDDDVEEF